MPKHKESERRQHPRIEHQLALKVAANGYDFNTTTKNVSCVGAYCRINKYVPPFTKIMIKLALPIAANNKSSISNVECKGVVIRTDDEAGGGFNIAIFFNAINDSQRHKISQYVSQFLPQNSSGLNRL